MLWPSVADVTKSPRKEGPMNDSCFQLAQSEVENNIGKLQGLMSSLGLTHFYLSSTDPHLNEYVPMEFCPRYYFTRFSGSMGEILVPQQGKVQLFVDGRYHEQADQEVHHEKIQVVKLKAKGIKESLLEAISREAIVGYEALRTSLQFAQQIKEKAKKAYACDKELAGLVPLVAPSQLPMVENLEGKVDISPLEKKLSRIYEDFAENEAIYLSALDQIAWISNLRGYHLPHLSSFLGRAIVTAHKLHLFVSPKISFEKLNDSIHVHVGEEAQLSEAFSRLKNNISTLYYDEAAINSFDYAMLLQVFGQNGLKCKKGGLVPYMSLKDDKEIKLIQSSFAKSNRAITHVLRWIRSSLAEGKEISERDIYDKTTECYREQGAKDQSFSTISGVGPHSSIIHFSSPQAEVKVKGEDVVLLDSGGYFESGFATDTTRTILAQKGATPHPKLVEIFTLVLKGMLNLQNAVVREGTPGDELDLLARGPIQEKGHDYAHGTGHGVGIYVHEGGINFSPRSAHQYVRPRQVVSIEPGIYLPGFGGVRHENIVLVRSHPQRDGYVFFEPLTWIEFDEELVDRSLLSPQEQQWLDDYQVKSRTAGNFL